MDVKLSINLNLNYDVIRKINNNRINIVLLSDSNIGKNELINTLLNTNFNIYNIKNINIYSENGIRMRNDEIENIVNNNNKNNDGYISENIFKVKNIIKFDKTKLKYNIIDIVGILEYEDIMEWYNINFRYFDIIIFIIDVNNLDLMKQYSLFEIIIKNIVNYPNVYLINIINRIDDINDYDEKIKCEQIKNNLNKIIEKISNNKTINCETFSICLEKAFLYEHYLNNKNLSQLSQKQKSKLSQFELGSRGNKYINDDNKLYCNLSMSINKSIIESTSYVNTHGYAQFIEYFNKNIVKNIDNIYINKNLELINSHSCNIVNIRDFIEIFMKILKQLFDTQIISFNLVEKTITSIFNLICLSNDKNNIINNITSLFNLSNLLNNQYEIINSSNNIIIKVIADKLYNKYNYIKRKIQIKELLDDELMKIYDILFESKYLDTNVMIKIFREEIKYEYNLENMILYGNIIVFKYIQNNKNNNIINQFLIDYFEIIAKKIITTNQNEYIDELATTINELSILYPNIRNKLYGLYQCKYLHCIPINNYTHDRLKLLYYILESNYLF